jgi:ectoine hydroxylase-related dioxygenase (phytanoyl-CoA dioxygenase family)
MPELTPRVVFDCNLFVQGIANRNSPARKALRLFCNGDIALCERPDYSRGIES